MSAESTTTFSTSSVYRNKHGECPKLTTKNYNHWSLAVEFLLRAANAWNIVQATEKAPIPPVAPTLDSATVSPASSSSQLQPNTRSRSLQPPASNPTAADYTITLKKYEEDLRIYESKLKDFEERAAQASAILFGSLTLRVQPYIGESRDPVEMWKALKRRCDISAKDSGPTHLLHRFFNDKPSPDETISEFAARMLNYQTTLQHTAEAISDRTLVNQILYRLPSSWSGIKKHIMDKPTSEQTLDYLLDQIYEHEAQAETDAAVNASTTGTALKTTSRRGRGGRRGQGGREGRNNNGGRGGGSNGEENSGGRNQNRFEPYGKVKCWYCLKEGHRKEDCQLRKDAQKFRNEDPRWGKKGNNSEAKIASGGLLMTGTNAPLRTTLTAALIATKSKFT